MGNPHPTKSKPCKIGRKHTGSPSGRQKSKRAQAARIHREQMNGRFRKFTEAVAAYWRGELETFPEFSPWP